MIELQDNNLTFRFPEVHPEAGCQIDFQRTLRIPDDNQEYPLPPGLGRFPVQHVDDYADHLPEAWRKHGGVFVPMYQAEALWINFSGYYPCAIKIAAGKINAVSGEAWKNELSAKPQDYVVSPEQPWLDGFNVSEGHIRQFVAMPLGEGYTAEEQITGEAEHGGLQIIVYPMKAEVYEKLATHRVEEVCYDMAPPTAKDTLGMGLAPGGLMRQKIYSDEYGIEAWELEHSSRCFVHLASSAEYQKITGNNPPHKPPTAQEYATAGLPWFDCYSDKSSIPGAQGLTSLGSIGAKFFSKHSKPLPDNQALKPSVITKLEPSTRVRDGKF